MIKLSIHNKYGTVLLIWKTELGWVGEGGERIGSSSQDHIMCVYIVYIRIQMKVIIFDCLSFVVCVCHFVRGLQFFLGEFECFLISLPLCVACVCLCAHKLPRAAAKPGFTLCASLSILLQSALINDFLPFQTAKLFGRVQITHFRAPKLSHRFMQVEKNSRSPTLTHTLE